MKRFALATGLCLSICLSGCFTPADFKSEVDEGGEDASDKGAAKAEIVASGIAKMEPQRKVTKILGEPNEAADGPGAPKYEAPFDGQPVSSTKTESGLLIEDFVVGKGREAKEPAELVLHYTGYLTNGFTFDSSKRHGKPFRFNVGQGRVIKGWDEGVKGMKVGGKRRITVPPELAYGERQAGRIPPNSTIIFTLELLGVEDPLPEPQGKDAYTGTPKKSEKKDNGLLVVDYKEGKGPEAKEGDEIVVHYTGMLPDGKSFDSSLTRKKPLTIQLGKGRVIKGWDQGLVGMKVGGLRKLVVPAELGYGDKARGPIPANSELIFTIELMAIR